MMHLVAQILFGDGQVPPLMTKEESLHRRS